MARMMTKIPDPDHDEHMSQWHRFVELTRRPGGRQTACQHCCFWEPNEFHEARLALDNRDGINCHDALWTDVDGQCKRKPPDPLASVIMTMGQLIGQCAWALETLANIEHDNTQDYSLDGVDQYEIHERPFMNANDWCGEFRARQK
jgi:hypothetical protein